MGLFDKKYCDICGEKISLLGNRKLEDGNMCSSCAKGISPFMTDRRQTTVTEMKEHFAYREANRQKLAAFAVTETYGEGKKVYVDRRQGAFIVSYDSPNSWDKENPDVIPLSEVSACNLDVRENREEVFTKDAQGNRKSYTPPRYKYDYDFYIKINVTNRWFNEIEFKLNNFDVEGLNSQKYHNYQILAQRIIGALTGTPVNISQGTGYNPAAVLTGAGFANAFVNQVAQNAQQAQYQQQGYQQPAYQQPQQPSYQPQQPSYQPQQPSYQPQQPSYQPQQPSYQPQQPSYQPQQPAQQPAPAAAGPWVCPNCQGENSSAFCEYCGTKRP